MQGSRNKIKGGKDKATINNAILTNLSLYVGLSSFKDGSKDGSKLIMMAVLLTIT